MEDKITLGQAIAYLFFSKENGQRPEGLKKDEIEYLDGILTRLKSLNPETRFNRLITLNKHADYTDLFICMFLHDDFDKEDLELLRFFNDNLECFEAYSHVLHDFIKKLEDLKN